MTKLGDISNYAMEMEMLRDLNPSAKKILYFE